MIEMALHTPVSCAFKNVQKHVQANGRVVCQVPNTHKGWRLCEEHWYDVNEQWRHRVENRFNVRWRGSNVILLVTKPFLCAVCTWYTTEVATFNVYLLPQGTRYWEVWDGRLLSGEEGKLLREHWYKLPSRINAVYQRKDGKTLFFKGNFTDIFNYVAQPTENQSRTYHTNFSQESWIDYEFEPLNEIVRSIDHSRFEEAFWQACSSACIMTSVGYIIVKPPVICFSFRVLETWCIM